MKSLILLLIFTSISLPQTLARSTALAAPSVPENQAADLAGRWRVKFTLSGVGEKNLILKADAKGSGSMLLLDTAADGRPAKSYLPVAWSRNTNDRFSVSGEAELPIGTCCRETGTLIFKGQFKSGGAVSGAAIFVTGAVDEENGIGFRSLVGTFTATRVP